MPKNIVKRVLKEKGMNMADLAKRIDLGYDYILKAVNGYNAPSEKIKKETARVLKMDADELWGE